MGKTELKLEIDSALLEQARAADIHMTIVLERALKAELGEAAAAERARRWAADSAEAIAAHNRFIEQYGAFGEDWRNW